MAKKKGDGNWIEDLHKGGLHESLGIAKGKKIGEARIKKAEHSRNPKVAKQARAAETLKGLRKRK